MRKYVTSILLLLAASVSAQAARVEFKCMADTNIYQHYEVNYNVEIAVETYQACYPSYSNPNILSCDIRVTDASLNYVNSYVDSTCKYWAQNKLNSLSSSVLPIGGWATVQGFGYLRTDVYGFPVRMATSTVYKTSSPSIRPPIENCGGRTRIICR